MQKTKTYDLIPANTLLIRDNVSFYEVKEGADEGKKHLDKEGVVLENYFNDIYHLFLNKLVLLTHETSLSHEDSTRIRALFEELLKIKALLQKAE